MTLTALVFLLSLCATQVAGQTFRRRRSSVGRIIAGCVVGGLFLLALVILTIIMARRRRQRQRAFVTNTMPPHDFASSGANYNGPGQPQMGTPGGNNISPSYPEARPNGNGFTNGTGYGGGEYPPPYPKPDVRRNDVIH